MLMKKKKNPFIYFLNAYLLQTIAYVFHTSEFNEWNQVPALQFQSFVTL